MVGYPSPWKRSRNYSFSSNVRPRKAGRQSSGQGQVALIPRWPSVPRRASAPPAAQSKFKKKKKEKKWWKVNRNCKVLVKTEMPIQKKKRKKEKDGFLVGFGNKTRIENVKIIKGVCAYSLFYFGLYWVFVALHGFPPVAMTRLYSLMQCGLLTVDTSLVAECGLQARGLQQLQHIGSAVAVCGLNCSSACGILPDQDPTHVLCIGRWTLNHWTTREISLFGHFRK